MEPFDANAMALSLHHGRRVVLDQVGGCADGVAVKVVGEETFRLCRELIHGMVLVSRDSICASIKVTAFLVAWIEISFSFSHILDAFVLDLVTSFRLYITILDNQHHICSSQYYFLITALMFWLVVLYEEAIKATHCGVNPF